MYLIGSIAIPAWHSVLLLSPALVAVAAVVVVRFVGSLRSAWTVARIASIVMMAAAAAAIAVRVLAGVRSGWLVRADTLGVMMLALATFVGWVVVRYSQNYLNGDPGERRYIGRLLTTLAAVCLVAVANNLIVLTLAWMGTSLALHGLLTFYGHRHAAVGAAHKKFLLARCADACMLGAVVAFFVAFDTFRIDGIVAAAASTSSLPMSARIGIAFVGLAAILKCAQLPFHGWLIQVMEAPTPVSALLHAGVVNLGGFVLLRFAPVVDRAVETRTMLVIVGSLTAAIAALVMTTRVSIKVSLAWSTCAQMGFMLLQCGLGVWEMALLHLAAHSVYKANAFLSAGGAVRDTQRRHLAGSVLAPTITTTVVATTAAVAGIIVVGWVWSTLPFGEPLPASVWVLAGVVALAVVPLVSPLSGAAKRLVQPATIAAAVAVPVVYIGLHEILGQLVPHGAAAPLGLLIIVAVALAATFVVQSLCMIKPMGTVVQRLYPWIYGGLFLDETFTRLAFRVWPPPTPGHDPSPLPRAASPIVNRTPRPQSEHPPIARIQHAPISIGPVS
ncbi:MAG: NADH-quinone oxidoreductase subunit L [Ilumatobacteraceae bacterium]